MDLGARYNAGSHVGYTGAYSWQFFFWHYASVSDAES